MRKLPWQTLSGVDLEIYFDGQDVLIFDVYGREVPAGDLGLEELARLLPRIEKERENGKREGDARVADQPKAGKAG